MSTPQELYQIAKAAKSGSVVYCPQCGVQFSKASYQQAFCSNKGQGNCKDAYWNSQGPRERTGKTVKPSAELTQALTTLAAVPVAKASGVATIDQARSHLVGIFGPEYRAYIENHLAGDFACELVAHLAKVQQQGSTG